jgi:hypothetical protein
MLELVAAVVFSVRHIDARKYVCYRARHRRPALFSEREEIEVREWYEARSYSLGSRDR